MNIGTHKKKKNPKTKTWKKNQWKSAAKCVEWRKKSQSQHQSKANSATTIITKL